MVSCKIAIAGGSCSSYTVNFPVDEKECVAWPRYKSREKRESGSKRDRHQRHYISWILSSFLIIFYWMKTIFFFFLSFNKKKTLELWERVVILLWKIHFVFQRFLGYSFCELEYFFSPSRSVTLFRLCPLITLPQDYILFYSIFFVVLPCIFAIPSSFSHHLTVILKVFFTPWNFFLLNLFVFFSAYI